MKKSVKFRETGRRLPFKIESQDELNHIANKWLSNDLELKLPKSFAKRRASFLKKIGTNRATELFKVEVEWLAEYYAKCQFNDGDDKVIRQRKNYCSALLGKEKVKILSCKIQTELHKNHLKENDSDPDPDDDYSEYMADHDPERMFPDIDLGRGR